MSYVLCLSLAKCAENYYIQKIRLVIGGEREEGNNSRGSDLNGTLWHQHPALVGFLKQPGVKQVAFANDLNGTGRIISLLEWLKHLLLYGLKIGYFPEPSKSWLIVKSEELE